MQRDRSRLASARLATFARHFLRHSSPPPLISGAARIDLTKQRTEFRSGDGPKITIRAALLVCLFEGDAGDLRVILIKRASTMSSHALIIEGEIALPGGKRDEGDANDVETALREAKEEIGLDPSLVNVVTVLEPFISVRGISVVPVVGILENRKAFQPVPNPGEVELVLDAPLEMFLKVLFFFRDNPILQLGAPSSGISFVHPDEDLCFKFEEQSAEHCSVSHLVGLLQ